MQRRADNESALRKASTGVKDVVSATKVLRCEQPLQARAAHRQQAYPHTHIGTPRRTHNDFGCTTAGLISPWPVMTRL